LIGGGCGCVGEGCLDGGFVVIVFLCVGVTNCKKVFDGVCAADGKGLQ
jgi:hypothetical protein